jgi:hypothetical protein
MNSSPDTTPPNTGQPGAETYDVLAREAGLPFQAALSTDAEVDPIAEWLSLMEVVQMLCPAWPVRDQPMQGNCWLL